MIDPRPPNLMLHLIYGEMFGLLAGLISLAEFEDSRSVISILVAATILGGFFGFLIWLVRQQRTAESRRHEIKRFFRRIARKRAQASRIAQINKPSFDSRLNQFVGANVQPGAEATEENNHFRSPARFWQRTPFHKRTPAKPIEYIRRLLQHISKVIHGG